MAEIEEGDCLDTWEELDDSGVLDKRIEKMRIPSTQLQNGHSSGGSGGVIILSEDLRCRYGMAPSVKILKRPQVTNGRADSPSNNDQKPRQPIKSLQQRELEYAEARLRILGEARSPEESPKEVVVFDDRIQKLQSKPGILKGVVEAPCGILRLPKGPDGTLGFNLRR